MPGGEYGAAGRSPAASRSVGQGLPTDASQEAYAFAGVGRLDNVIDSGHIVASGERSVSSIDAARRDAFAQTVHLVGRSAAMLSIKDIACSVARRRSTVMLLGETGTGKEMLARHIHACSDRSARPFITVDCSAMTDTLFESQLFGHRKGAFTGAVRDSLGFARAADGGTLFVDEVGELPLTLQSKLLRMIQEKIVTPVGDTRGHKVDIRVVCATHRDLRQMVRDGTFREDLYFRLNVIVLEVPPLRERPGDTTILAAHFLRQQSSLYSEPNKRLSPQAAAALQGFNWPGNVRELANVMEHAYVLGGEVIELTDLPERLRNPSADDATIASDLRLADVERQTIAEALRRTRWNKSASAKLLGINVQKLNRRISALGIRAPRSANLN